MNHWSSADPSAARRETGLHHLLLRWRIVYRQFGFSMEAALLELEAADELHKDGEDDVDFFVEKGALNHGPHLTVSSG